MIPEARVLFFCQISWCKILRLSQKSIGVQTMYYIENQMF